MKIPLFRISFAHRGEVILTKTRIFPNIKNRNSSKSFNFLTQVFFDLEDAVTKIISQQVWFSFYFYSSRILGLFFLGTVPQHKRFRSLNLKSKCWFITFNFKHGVIYVQLLILCFSYPFFLIAQLTARMSIFCPFVFYKKMPQQIFDCSSTPWKKSKHINIYLESQISLLCQKFLASLQSPNSLLNL